MGTGDRDGDRDGELPPHRGMGTDAGGRLLFAGLEIRCFQSTLVGKKINKNHNNNNNKTQSSEPSLSPP